MLVLLIQEHNSKDVRGEVLGHQHPVHYLNKEMNTNQQQCKNCEVLESGSIIKVDLNGNCVFCNKNISKFYSTNQQQNWREEFSQMFFDSYDNFAYPEHEHIVKDFISSTIQSEVSKERERIIEKIINAKPLRIKIKTKEVMSWNY